MKIITRPAELNGEPQIESIAPKGDVLLFDIETTGLKKGTSQVYLIGCAYYEQESWMIRQYLTESAMDEREVLEAFFDFSRQFKVLVHFNGDGFDIPFLDSKQEFYDLGFSFDDFDSFDIYRKAKTLRKLLCMSSMGLTAIERFLQIEREDQMNGGLLIPYYYTYERTGDPEAERLLLLHNFDDLQGMLKILDILKYLEIPDGYFHFENMETAAGYAILNYHLDEELPVSFEKRIEKPEIVICADGSLLQISIKLYEGIAKYPLTDVENYYYLPEEDRVIHKDVAQYVEKQYRKKATKKNCFLKKEGQFLPQNQPLFDPAYYIDGDKKRSYFDIAEIKEGPEVFRQYALDIINS